jgi:hypothetical protein
VEKRDPHLSCLAIRRPRNKEVWVAAVETKGRDQKCIHVIVAPTFSFIFLISAFT